jgi:LEA14-like dessication related protein
MRYSALAVLIIAACKTAPDTKPAGAPELTSQEVEIKQELTEFSIKFVGKLKSPDAATIEKANWELVVDGKVVKTGEAPLSVQAPAGVEAPFEIATTSKYVESAAELKAMDTRGGYLLGALRGKLTLRRNGKTEQLEFAKSHEVRTPRLPQVKMHSIDGARYSPDEANILFSVGVVNPNPFPIRISGVDYKLTIAGKPMSDGTLGKGDKVEPSSTGVFEVQIAVNQETYGKEVGKLIKSLTLPYQMTGELKGDLLAEAYDLKGDIKLNVSK